jgi:hypothetical protein
MNLPADGDAPKGDTSVFCLKHEGKKIAKYFQIEGRGDLEGYCSQRY